MDRKFFIESRRMMGVTDCCCVIGAVSLQLIDTTEKVLVVIIRNKRERCSFSNRWSARCRLSGDSALDSDILAVGAGGLALRAQANLLN
jgi:hypothetical protein